MNISDYLDKENLHHAYLIEGEAEDTTPAIFKFIESLGIKTIGNPDFCNMALDSLKIDDARKLKLMVGERGYTDDKKIFIISANSFLLEAQNALLKVFEEPIKDTHFFIIVPNTDSLIKTFVSRFYLIKSEGENKDSMLVAEKFLKMNIRQKLDFIKELLVKTEDTDEESNKNSARSKGLRFLDALELVIHKKIMSKDLKSVDFFDHILKVREFLRMPGSSVKTLLESVALVIPSF